MSLIRRVPPSSAKKNQSSMVQKAGTNVGTVNIRTRRSSAVV